MTPETKRRTMLITGASKGLGSCLALEYARNGYDLIINGRDVPRLEQTAASAVAAGASCALVQGDIRSPGTVELLMRHAERADLYGLVNNAGVYVSRAAADTAQEELREVMDVNFHAPVELVRRSLPFFLRKPGSLIVNINSFAGRAGSRNEAAYAASKHALRGYMEALRLEATAKGVRIIDVYLGGMQTDMTRERREYDLLIRPEEAARVIVRASMDEPSVCPNELHLGRRNY